jgi:uncharacterized protein YndB with AHSA1/START domain
LISLTLIRTIAARPSVVFAALTSPEGMASWWGPDEGPVLIAESELQVGGRYRVRFRMLDGNEYEAEGEYLAVDPPTRLSMTFRWHSADESDVNRIDITLRPIAMGTELTFVHSGFKDDTVRDDHAQGWSGALEKMARRFAADS